MMNKKFFSLLIAILLLGGCKGEDYSVAVERVQLSEKLAEISGLARVGDRFFGHNDGGDRPVLYEFNHTSGEVLREVLIEGADNLDWESITADERYLYIGDIGGNNFDRDQMQIYKVLISDVLENNSVESEKTIIYKNENHPKDFEAMYIKDNNLYLLSKNVTNYICEIFKVDLSTSETILGDAVGRSQLKVAVTEADYSVETGELALIGYNKPSRRKLKLFRVDVLRYSQFTNSPFEKDAKLNQKTLVNSIKVAQAEGILYSESSNSLYISSERKAGDEDGTAALYKLFF